ncbi:FecCD family ABC transporter permease [Roseibium aggregatum]|uniref:Iron ABC transporter permease n=1 Tax=Roseibium aggregatum TaxID=187304 RepID=A0A926P5A7_9HYPH|nr:iron ABC transporter permease [Roseibium aggregatum]MBD1547532.1 iron ABC transporter permease [Roseibium aggregatum]
MTKIVLRPLQRHVAAARDGDRAPLARSAIALLAVLLGCAMLVSLNSGALEIQALKVMASAFDPPSTLSGEDLRDRIVFFQVRLPRVCLGALVGASLAVSGAVMQGLFRNPLADPGIIGVSSGAGLGAAGFIILGQSWLAPVAALLGVFSLPVSAFVGALLVTSLLYRIGTSDGLSSVATMLLAGIAISALAMSMVGLLIFYADDQQLRDLTFWNLGSLAGASWEKVATCALIVSVALVVALSLSRGLNALFLGEAAAGHLGIRVQRLKTLAIVAVAAATGASVAVSVGIGFVGIVVPHLLRLTIGPDHRYLLPASALLGAVMLILADTVSRIVVAPAELPIGILTALAGAPFFLWILLRRRGLTGL